MDKLHNVWKQKLEKEGQNYLEVKGKGEARALIRKPLFSF